jgi:hypothetical protein
MARLLCQPGGKANEGAGGARVREREGFPGLKTAKTPRFGWISMRVGWISIGKGHLIAEEPWEAERRRAAVVLDVFAPMLQGLDVFAPCCN